MAKIIFIEGPRLVGKSTVARELRNRINYATLINCTGFPEDGDRGLAKISSYYSYLIEYLNQFEDEDITFIFDRFMFSEVVFSKLYKSYDFKPYYEKFLSQLSRKHRVDFFLFQTSDVSSLLGRSKGREKASFVAGDEEARQLELQSKEYEEMFWQLFHRNYTNFSLHHWIVDHSTIEELYTDMILLTENS